MKLLTLLFLLVSFNASAFTPVQRTVIIGAGTTAAVMASRHSSAEEITAATIKNLLYCEEKYRERIGDIPEKTKQKTYSERFYQCSKDIENKELWKKEYSESCGICTFARYVAAFIAGALFVAAINS